MAGREIATSYPLECEGKAVSGTVTPLRDNPTSISVTLYREGDDYKREVGCGFLDKGRCIVSGNQPCIHLFPETSDVIIKESDNSRGPREARIALDGSKLREFRLAAGMTQKELGLASRSVPTLVSKIELAGGQHKTNPQRAQMFANALGVSIEEILFREGGPEVSVR